jgi:hypothetical protein
MTSPLVASWSTAVKVISSKGGQPILSVEVFLPMRRFENKAERERVRSDVYKRVQGSFQNLGRYRNCES